MARIIFSGIVSSIRGSISGSTFQKNRFGYTMRNKPIPSFSASDDQQVTRANMTFLQQVWKNNNEGLQTLYNDYALNHPTFSKNNPGVALPGYQVFIKYNLVRLLTGLSVLTEITFDTLWNPGVTVEASIVSSSLRIDVAATITAHNSTLVAYVTGPVKDSVNRPFGSLRFIAKNGGDDTGYIYNSNYITKIGRLPVAGETVFVQTMFMANNWPEIGAPIYNLVQVT